MASPAALQLLASLTRLTWLDLSRTAVAAGLQHLTALKGLEELRLDGCEGVTDEHLQPLSALPGLIRLDARDTGLQSGSLVALSSLRHLGIAQCSGIGAAALEAVARLTRLTYLDIAYTATEAGPAQLAQLARLTSLREVRMWGHSIRHQAAALLDLPHLGTLCATSVAVPQGQDLSGCAITQLVLLEPAAADLQALPQLPALQSLFIQAAPAGISGISAQAQLTELVLGDCEGVQGAELTTALQCLQQLQVLELGHADCFDRQCLVALAGMRQLRELWLDGGWAAFRPAWCDWLGMLHRCTRLQQLTLQGCFPISEGILMGLVSHPGMQRVVLRAEHGLAAEVVSALREQAGAFGCELLCEEELCVGPRADEFFNIELGDG